MAITIQLRRDTTANWESINPILADGEIGIDTTIDQFKIGNGTDNWNTLAYSGTGASLWEADGSYNIKPIGGKTVDAQYLSETLNGGLFQP